jgi:hypothetical protein
MPDTVTIQVEGLTTIDAALRELPRALQHEILGDSLSGAGEVLSHGIAELIRSRSGKTVADLRVEVQVRDDDVAGAAAVGEKASRTYVLRFLEFGTRPHLIPKKNRTLRGAPAKHPAFGGRVFSRIHHPGTHAQAPMRLALANRGEEAIKVFAQRAWDGIVAALARMHGTGVA